MAHLLAPMHAHGRRCTALSGGCEKGDKKGKLHLQTSFEWWDAAGLSEVTVRRRVHPQPSHRSSWHAPAATSSLLPAR